jgi:hypothetical protein
MMSQFHCSCGFAIDAADEFGDHLRQVFARADDLGTDGQAHLEVADADPARLVCACGLAATGTAELDDHLLMVFIGPDGMGIDGERHVPVDPSTPDRWYVRDH